MTKIVHKFRRMLFYAKRDVLLKYVILHLISGYKILTKGKDIITIETRFDKIIYELPTVHDEYLFVANPINELLVSTFMNMTSGTFIDVGAFIGRHSIRLARNNDVRVIAIEPNPISLPLLKRNLDLNGVREKVEIVEAALVSNETISEITFAPNHGRSKILLSDSSLSNSSLLVKTIPFNKLITEYKIDFNREVIMKIDIEGYEHELIFGMKNFLKNSTNKFKIVCEILHNSPLKNDTIKFLKELNFNVLQVDGENYFIYKN